ncbi:ATP-dependent lipid A-core flippase-like [Littorina saxatilis]
MLALVGPLGSGKSTVLKLLQRFYAVDSGTVKVDGTPLFDLDIAWWREQVCALIHDPEITSGRVKDNITYGDLREHISMAEITEAAKIADIHSRIQSLPQGYETILEGNGSAYFNRAERTRLAIARAAFKDPCVLLVDNIAASLEPKDAKEVLETLWKFCEGRTTIVATNQLAEIPHADHILVLSHGKVIESGTHEELMKIKGCYAMILLKQVNLDKLKMAHQRMRRVPKKRVHVINKTITEGRRMLSSRGLTLAYVKGKNKLKMYP